MYWKIFKNSLTLPKKDALFFLNRVPMGHTLIYILVLMHLAFLPNLIKFSFTFFHQYENIPRSVFWINVIVLYPFLTVFLMITGITILSFFSFLLAKLLQRKLSYPYLWKITAYALTVPLMLHALSEILSFSYLVTMIVLFVILYSIIFKIIMIYPQKKQRLHMSERSQDRKISNWQ